MAAVDWAGLLRRGLGPAALGGLGLSPQVFWALSPVELRLMLGEPQGPATLGRAGLQALMARFPDGAAQGGDPHVRT